MRVLHSSAKLTRGVAKELNSDIFFNADLTIYVFDFRIVL